MTLSIVCNHQWGLFKSIALIPKFWFKGNLFLLLLLWSLFSCRKEVFYQGDRAELRFSLDTLRFDTVFTARGSATRSVKIFNDYDATLQISSIAFGSDSRGKFRYNLDGIPQRNFEGVTIPPKDSIYLFVEVTIDPDEPLSLSPFVVEDQLIFDVNGHASVLYLEAWGQNANYIPNRFNQGQFALLSCGLNEVVWSDSKPYVIYGVLFVDSCTLVIPAGARIYVHGGIGISPNNEIYNDGMLFFLEAGRLRIDGTHEFPVIIQGDRLESEFRNIPGQWAGIRFSKLSRGPHILKNTDIRNAIFGLYADSLVYVQMENISISNTSLAGVIGVNAHLSIKNSLFYDNFGSGLNLNFGGTYQIDFCTFSNDGLSRDVIVAQNYLCNDPNCTAFTSFPMQLNVKNSILHNSGNDAILLRARDQTLQYEFSHNSLRIRDLVRQPFFSDFQSRCISCIYPDRMDKLFANVREKDFRLDSVSIARGAGLFNPLIPTDKTGAIRKNPPDIGCFEWAE